MMAEKLGQSRQRDDERSCLFQLDESQIERQEDMHHGPWLFSIAQITLAQACCKVGRVDPSFSFTFPAPLHLPLQREEATRNAWTSGPLQAPPVCRCGATAVFVRCLCRLGLGTLAQDAPRHNEADPSKDVGSGVMCEW